MGRDKSIFHFERLVISVAITMVLLTSISFGLGVKGGYREIQSDTIDTENTQNKNNLKEKNGTIKS